MRCRRPVPPWPTIRSAPSSPTWAWCRCRTRGSTPLVALYRPQVGRAATVNFVDIAGLVRGASKGEGLGNQFLANIRETDAIAHVVRCFEDANIVHVEGRIDPVSDVLTIDTELCLKDLETVDKRIERAKTAMKGGAPRKRRRARGLPQGVQEGPGRGRAGARAGTVQRGERLLRELFLLTHKKVFYVANVAEKQLATGDGDPPWRPCAPTRPRKAPSWSSSARPPRPKSPAWTPRIVRPFWRAWA